MGWVNKIDSIRFLMRKGYAKELLRLVEGESPYTTDASEGVPLDPYLRGLWIVVVHHLRFVVEFGHQEKVVQNGKYLSSFPNEFEQWLQAGAPGIGVEDIEACLRSVCK